MKASFYRIEAAEQESFRFRRICEHKLGTPWHFHPEYQLTLLVRGRGHRLVGDTITQLQPGDLTLLGPNLPHFWHTGDVDGSAPCPEALMIHFRGDFLGAKFFNLPEMRPIEMLLRRADCGLQFTPTVRRELVPLFERILSCTGPERIAGLITILSRLARARGTRAICTSGFAPFLDWRDQQRLERVCNHIHEQLTRPIFREELAQLAGLSPRTFSRYFRQKMGKTLPQFINELRVGRACRLLLETEQTVAEIAFQCGFENLSNFNRCFRAAKHITPSTYRSAGAWK